MLFDRDEVVIANGVEALKSVGKAAIDEILALLPQACGAGGSARPGPQAGSAVVGAAASRRAMPKTRRNR